jgi:serine/threonine protein kinase/tetratricopeptide (TPR) repeat protein
MNNQANPKAELKEIFLAACQLSDVDQRAAYLAQRCGDDTELRQRIVTMLAAEESQKPSALERMRAIVNTQIDSLDGLDFTGPLDIEVYPRMRPFKLLEITGDGGAGVVDADRQTVPILRAGMVIGRYKLRELLGEGGMGSVYVAEQEHPVRRKVALKIIKPGMDSRQVISRFQSERQALALMEHPNIAKVLDVGTTDNGLPYFVMELVQGVPITEHCDNQNLGTRQRLKLFIQLCQAVQHAHQKGIIHRDIKPSNVMVSVHDVKPVVKVIDFGVAKAIGQQLTDNTMYTALSQVVGTPMYMSPEQARESGLDIDTRSDVYSLGIVLYELLTGTAPFDRESFRKAGLDEVRRIIREVDPPKPSLRVSKLKAEEQSTVANKRQMEPRKLVRQITGDLDWIVMKALEKDRERRYETPNSLAQDLERYLNDQPVEACPPSAIYRLQKSYRRHRTVVLTTSVVLFALLIATVTSVAFAVQEHQRSQRRQLAQRRIHDVLNEVTLLRGQTRMDLTATREILAQARNKLQRAVALAETELIPPEVQVEVMQQVHELELESANMELLNVFDEAWMAIASTDPALGRWAPEACVPILSRALEARGLKVGQTPADEAVAAILKMPETIRSPMLVALEEWADSRSSQLGTVLKQVDHASTTVSFAATKFVRLSPLDKVVGFGTGPDGPIAELTKDIFLLRTGKYLSPKVGTTTCLLVQRRGQVEAQTFEVVPDPMRSWLMTLVERADTDPWRKRLRDAYELTNVDELRTTLEKLANEADFTRQPVRSLTRLAAILAELKEMDKSLALARQVQRRFPSDVHANIVLSHILKMANPPQLDESLRFCTAAVALCPSSACIQLNLGKALSDLGKKEEAIIQYREALRLQPRFLLASMNICSILRQSGKHQEAVEELRNFVKTNPESGRAHYSLGTALMEQGMLEEAEFELSEAVRLDPNQSASRVNLAYVLNRRGRFDEAIEQYREGLRRFPGFDFANMLAATLAEQGKHDEALALLQEWMRNSPNNGDAYNGRAWFRATAVDPKFRIPNEAVDLASKAVQISPNNGTYLNTLGVAQYRAGQWNEAIETLGKSVALLPESHFAYSGFFLAMAHWQFDQRERANEYYEKAVESMARHLAGDVELERFRKEAEELMGVDTQEAPNQLEEGKKPE